MNGYDVKKEGLMVRRSIGLVPDISNLYEELTVEENLKFTANLYDAPKENVARLIKEFNLPAKRKFGKLSSGFKRRVTIAAALVHEPEILFLDEPTNGLDVHSAKALRALIRELNKRGMTIFLTTHNMVEAETIPQRVAIMNKGKIIAEGTRTELPKLIGKGTRIRLQVEPLSNKLLDALSAYGPTFDEGDIVITVPDADAFMAELCKLREELGFKVLKVSTEAPSIEEVFIELTTEVPKGGACGCGGVLFEGSHDSEEGTQGVRPQAGLNKLGRCVPDRLHVSVHSPLRRHRPPRPGSRLDLDSLRYDFICGLVHNLREEAQNV